MTFLERINGYKKIFATISTVAAIWVLPLPIEVKVAKTVIVVVAWLFAQGAVDVAERLANGKKEPSVTGEKAA